MAEYLSGYPTERGLYRCKVDGREQILVHHYCGTNRRHWWTDTAGHDIVSDVKFDPNPVAVRKRDT